MVDSAGPSVSLPVSSNEDVPSPAEQPAVLSMASFQSMISSMAHDALGYSIFYPYRGVEGNFEEYFSSKSLNGFILSPPWK